MNNILNISQMLLEELELEILKGKHLSTNTVLAMSALKDALHEEDANLFKMLSDIESRTVNNPATTN